MIYPWFQLVSFSILLSTNYSIAVGPTPTPCSNSPSPSEPWYPVRGYCNVIPKENWDSGSSIVRPTSAMIPPNGTQETCSIFNAKPDRSCAARGSLPSVDGNNTDDIATKVMIRINRSQDTKLKADFKTMLDNYKATYCGQSRMKACVKSYPHACAVVLPDSQNQPRLGQKPYPNLDILKKDVINFAEKETHKVYLKEMIEEAVKRCQDTTNKQYSEFNSHNIIKGTYPQPTRISNWIDKASFTTKILDDLGKQKITTLLHQKYYSELDNAGYSFFSEPKSPVPEAIWKSTKRISFEDSSANIISSSEFIDEIDLRKLFKKKSSSAPFTPTQVVGKIIITASSSTGSNTKNFCQKDYINLNKARAEKVKQLLLDNFDISPALFSLPSTGGKNSDGSSGPCAYRCKSNNLTTCEEEYRVPKISDTILNENQNVAVEFLPIGKTGINSSKEYELRISTTKHDVAYGCEFEEVKNCIEPDSTTGDPGNLIK